MEVMYFFFLHFNFYNTERRCKIRPLKCPTGVHGAGLKLPARVVINELPGIPKQWRTRSEIKCDQERFDNPFRFISFISTISDAALCLSISALNVTKSALLLIKVTANSLKFFVHIKVLSFVNRHLLSQTIHKIFYFDPITFITCLPHFEMS